MARPRTLRAALYRNARLLGNIQAAERGPLSFAQRYARRKVYAKTNGATRRLLRQVGLSR
jgi:hypothetical protein